MTTTAEPTAAEAPEPTSLLPQPIIAQPFPEHEVAKGSMFLNVLRTTDHKLIGKMYLVTSFLFFFLGGVMALLHARRAGPSRHAVPQSPEQYNQLFTMHGTIMLLFFATPLVFAFANLVLPLQIGSPDVRFPRLNAFSYWLYLFGALTATSGFVTPGGAADFGWTFYMPLNDGLNSPGVGARPVDRRSGYCRSRHDPRRRQHDHHRDHPACARHDDVPDADLHLEHPGHQPAGAPRVPDPDRGSARRVLSTAIWTRRCTRRTTAGPFSGNTCSGSSATLRSTSSRCRSSAS